MFKKIKILISLALFFGNCDLLISRPTLLLRYERGTDNVASLVFDSLRQEDGIVVDLSSEDLVQLPIGDACFCLRISIPERLLGDRADEISAAIEPRLKDLPINGHNAQECLDLITASLVSSIPGFDDYLFEFQERSDFKKLKYHLSTIREVPAGAGSEAPLTEALLTDDQKDFIEIYVLGSELILLSDLMNKRRPLSRQESFENAKKLFILMDKIAKIKRRTQMRRYAAMGRRHVECSVQ